MIATSPQASRQRSRSRSNRFSEHSRTNSALSEGLNFLFGAEEEGDVKQEPKVREQIKAVDDKNQLTNAKFKIQECLVDQILYHIDKPEEYLTIKEILNPNDLNSIVLIALNETTGEKIEISLRDFHNYSKTKNVKLILVTYLNKVHELDLPLFIHYTFEKMLDDITRIYNFSNGSLNLIFKNKLYNHNDRQDSILYKDYDFKNDTFIIIQNQQQPCSIKISDSNSVKIRNETREMYTYFVVQNSMKLNYIDFADSDRGAQATILDFLIFEIQGNKEDCRIFTANSDKKLENVFNFDLVVDNKKKSIYSSSKIPILKTNENNRHMISKNITIQKDKVFCFYMKFYCSGDKINMGGFYKGKGSLTSGDNTISFFNKDSVRDTLIRGIGYTNYNKFEEYASL
jgi:hypothetical protein